MATTRVLKLQENMFKLDYLYLKHLDHQTNELVDT